MLSIVRSVALIVCSVALIASGSFSSRGVHDFNFEFVAKSPVKRKSKLEMNEIISQTKKTPDTDGAEWFHALFKSHLKKKIDQAIWSK